MRSSPRFLPTTLPLLALVLACGDIQAPEATADDLVSAVRVDATAAARTPMFHTHLTGAEEVAPVETNAQGQANFRLSADGTELSYRLMASNIENVLMAHIHLAPAGENGGIVVWLYPDAPPPALIPGRHGGILATGVITEDDLVGALVDATLADLVAAIEAGDTYVNVHTTANPGGEIRGQLD
jgi:CHRD domain